MVITLQSRQRKPTVFSNTYTNKLKKTSRSFSSILEYANISLENYLKVLHQCSQATTLVLEKNPFDCTINTHVMRAWQGNVEIQILIDAYACSISFKYALFFYNPIFIVILLFYIILILENFIPSTVSM